MSANEYKEGDLVEGVKGESVVRGRLDNIGNLIIDGLDWRVASLIRSGFTITVIEKAAPVVVLPTEPGVYVDKDQDIWMVDSPGAIEFLMGYPVCGNPENYGPFTRLEPVSETAKKVLSAVRKVWPLYDLADLDDIADDFGVEL